MDRRGNRWSERGHRRAKGGQHRGYERGHWPARGGHGDESRSCAEADARRPGYDASLYPEPEPKADLQTVAVRPEFNPVPEFNQLSLGNGDRVCPVRRPDKGGSLAARHVSLLVNHFRATFNPETIIRHYDVDIKPEAPVRHRHPARLSKATLSQIKQISGFSIPQFARYRREVEQALKGVKVTVTHRRTKQKYTVEGLTKETTRSISFSSESSEGKTSEINLVNHFREKYEIDIKYKDIPCLDFSKNNKKQYVPMELCELVEGQRYPKENLGRGASTLLKNISMPRPDIRKKSICDMMRSNTGPCGDVSRNFGIEVDMNMTKVGGRVIGPPELKLATPDGRMRKIEVDKVKCQWNLVGKAVVDGKPIERWGIVDFSASDRNRRLNYERFIENLISKCRNLGIRMENPLFYQAAAMSMFSNVARLTELLDCRVGRWRPQFLLCVMSGRDDGYKHLKWICETRAGLVTQCCLSMHANRANDQYLANLALKINAKLGGSNVELFNRFPHIDGEGHVMFLGADVNHPASCDKISPSFAAVVGTVNWPAANRYAARVRPQLHRKEEIVNIGEMCLELVETYAGLNRVRPGKLVLFRDGVSESQFDMVLNEELQDLKKAFSEKDYRPTITIIVAQKRHQTRLFPERDVDGGPAGNVPPGTVVDTTVVHPFEFDFYLCSHYGGIGTSKPTYYHVLWDEHRFSSDHLEKLIYSLCFTFARCTKPVSLVTPVYYADLAAYRGRLYHEAAVEHSPSPNEERFYKLHPDVENMMFFV